MGPHMLLFLRAAAKAPGPNSSHLPGFLPSRPRCPPSCSELTLVTGCVGAGTASSGWEAAVECSGLRRGVEMTEGWGMLMIVVGMSVLLENNPVWDTEEMAGTCWAAALAAARRAGEQNHHRLAEATSSSPLPHSQARSTSLPHTLVRHAGFKTFPWAVLPSANPVSSAWTSAPPLPAARDAPFLWLFLATVMTISCSS